MRAYDPRSIAFLAELMHFPQEHPAEAVRRLYNRLGEVDASWYLNLNMDPRQGTAQFVTTAGAPTPGRPVRVSAVNLLVDRIQIQEEWTDLTPESYVERLQTVADRALEVLGIPRFTAQQYVVRSVVTPRATADARQFLGQVMCRFSEEELRVWERPASTMGIRFMFPNTENDPTLFNVRIESFNLDVRSLFLEVGGVFPEPLTSDGTDALARNFQRVYDYLAGNVCRFVAQFDG